MATHPPPAATALLEIAVDDVEGALAAAAAGADRLEVCAALECGGLSPSLGLVAELRARTSLPLVVMVRPRAGDFVYSGTEVDVMRRDIEAYASLGVAGLALGVATSRGDLDAVAMRKLVVAAGALPVACHRAYDDAPDPWLALDALIDAGCARVLTSGGATTAAAGVAGLQARQAHAGARLTIVAAGSVRATSAEPLRAAGLREFHAGPRVVHPARPGHAYSGHTTTDADAVRALALVLGKSV